MLQRVTWLRAMPVCLLNADHEKPSVTGSLEWTANGKQWLGCAVMTTLHMCWLMLFLRLCWCKGSHLVDSSILGLLITDFKGCGALSQPCSWI